MLTFCLQLKLASADGKYYATDCANTQSMFRIIQSIPSPKAEPFKQWLTQDGGEVAGNARSDAEKRIGKPIVSDENYLEVPEKVKRVERKKTSYFFKSLKILSKSL